MDYQVVLSDLFVSDLKEIVDYLAILADVDDATHSVNILRAWHGARAPNTLRMEGLSLF